MREACALPPGGAARVQEGGLSPRGGNRGDGSGPLRGCMPCRPCGGSPALCLVLPSAPFEGEADGIGKGFGLLVSLGCRRRRPCTCDLSTSSSPTALPDWTSYL